MTKECKHCQNHCSSCAERQARAFELEVDEELQQERLTNFWKKYAWLVYTGIFLILALTVAIELYSNWRIKTRLTESDLFEQAVVDIQQGKTPEGIENLKKLSQSAHTDYKILAQLELADIYMTQKDTAQALSILQDIIQGTKNTNPLHHVAILTFVGYQLDSDKPEELYQMLSPTLDNPYFQGLATELAVILLKKQNKTIEANALIEKAVANSTVSADSVSRLQSLSRE